MKNKCSLRLVFMLCLVLSQGPLQAQAQRFRKSAAARSNYKISYDLGASSGSYNGYSYSEVNLGLNLSLSDSFVWRNSIFNRFGSNADSTLGLDTSLRYVFDSRPEAGEIGFHFFAGPGYRISNEKNTAAFAEAGATLRAGGLAMGLGVKSLYYNNPGKRSDGTELPKSDTELFIILAGGGSL